LTISGDDTAAPKRVRRPANARKPTTNRSRIGTGKTLMCGIDQRSLSYREYQDAYADLTHHLGGAPTATEEAMIAEASGLIVWCRAQRVLLLTGGDFQIQPYTTACNSLRRLLVDLGLEQRMTDVTPSIEEYIAQKRRTA
jgi:hypothetical protein